MTHRRTVLKGIKILYARGLLHCHMQVVTRWEIFVMSQGISRSITLVRNFFKLCVKNCVLARKGLKNYNTFNEIFIGYITRAIIKNPSKPHSLKLI